MSLGQSKKNLSFESCVILKSESGETYDDEEYNDVDHPDYNKYIWRFVKPKWGFDDTCMAGKYLRGMMNIRIVIECQCRRIRVLPGRVVKYSTRSKWLNKLLTQFKVHPNIVLVGFLNRCII